MKRIIFIGETHGTKEIPLEVNKLCKNIKGKVIYCLELPIQLKVILTDFLANKISLNELLNNNFIKEPVQDGRLTPQLIQSLINLNEKIKVEYIDDLKVNILQREKFMANKITEIIKKNRQDTILVHCGSFHVLSNIIEFNNKRYTPMRLFLRKNIINNSDTFIYVPIKGSYYNQSIHQVITKKQKKNPSKSIKFICIQVSPSYFELNM